MRLNYGIKTCAAIHDVSCIGKCSLTVALPILSAMGVETGVLPTAVLSNHTGFQSFSYRDLTEDLPAIAQRWKEEGAAFDALYSGFLGSCAQIGMVADIFRAFKTEDNLVVVDPVMGDHGALYKTYTREMADGVRSLCREADIIVPNLTEAAYMTGTEYREGLCDQGYIEALLKKLTELGPRHVVLTGVCDEAERLGSACMDRKTGEIAYSFHKQYPGSFHGTGDVFASVLTGAVLMGFTVPQAQELACEFVGKSIATTIESGREPKFGVFFETHLPWLFAKCTGRCAEKSAEKACNTGAFGVK